MRRTLAIVFGLLVGCSGARSAKMAMTAPAAPPTSAAAPSPAPAPAPAALTPPPAPSATHTQSKFSAAGTATGTTELLAPSIIYTGALAMLVDDDQLAPALDKAIDLAEAAGGFQSMRNDTSVELRVPAPRFREVLRELETLGQVTSRSVNAQDVSEEIHDAEVRITNLRATRKRLQELLAKAHNITETLTVERELERVALEIDKLEGRVRFLKTRASYSTIVVNVAPRPRVANAVAAGPTRRVPAVVLPIPWLDGVGAARLLNLE